MAHIWHYPPPRVTVEQKILCIYMKSAVLERFVVQIMQNETEFADVDIFSVYNFPFVFHLGNFPIENQNQQFWTALLSRPFNLPEMKPSSLTSTFSYSIIFPFAFHLGNFPIENQNQQFWTAL